MTKLAINGGSPVRRTYFPPQVRFDSDELAAILELLKSGQLTGYQGNLNAFRGGPKVQELEQVWAGKFSRDSECPAQCVPVNSCTSGLFVACQAIGLKPGDEVIVTPYSMTCSATVPLIFGAKPVFADIEKDYYCLDPKSVEEKITNRTKAIIVVDLFGQPYDRDAINLLANEHEIYVIEDAAQAVGAKYHEDYCGTLGDIGVHSFNLGKHLTSGEGGLMVTHHTRLALLSRLAMNHGEAVVNDMIAMIAKDKYQTKIGDPNTIFGFNLRLTEIQAQMILGQLARNRTRERRRITHVEFLQDGLGKIPGLSIPPVRPGCTHTYYVMPLEFDETVWGVHRNRVVEAVKAELKPCKGREHEGVPIGAGYIKPIYRMPVFNVQEPICPVCEDKFNNKLIVMHRFFGPEASLQDLSDVVSAFEKVWENRGELG